MNRVDRLLAMILLLQSRRVITAEEIAQHFELSVRTVYRDLAALGESGVPIAAEAGVGYSLVKGYHLPPVMFTAEEASALSTGGQLVAHLTDSSLRKHMDSALIKIRSTLPANQRDYLERLERFTAVVPRPSGSLANPDNETLVPIQRGIAERRVLAMEYKSGRKQEITRRKVEPLGLLYYTDSWHLIAFCRLRGDLRDFRTDRILKLELLGERFNGHDDFSLQRYLQSQMDAPDFPTARIKFIGLAAERARKEWTNGLVDEQIEPDGVTATLVIPSLRWLTGWLLSFGASAIVLAPEELRGSVAAEAWKIAAQYSFPNPRTPSANATVPVKTF